MSIAEMIVPDLHRRGPRAVLRPRRPDVDPESAGWTKTWTSWRTTASVTVTDPTALPAARRLVSQQFAAVEKAAARFRKDAELHRLYRAGGRPITVSPLLAELIAAALATAERTDGDVDPTVAAAMTAIHAPRQQHTSALPVCASRLVRGRPAPGWQQVHLRGRRLQVPAGSTLDLSATATSVACDRAAAEVRTRLNVGVLVTLGGDAASAGPGTEGSGWPVTIDDRRDGHRTEVLLPAGSALATSHFTAHPERIESAETDHLIDPRTGQPPIAIWRMATVIGFTGLEASTYSAATLIRGTSARNWLAQLWVPARLVTVHDEVITVGPWRLHQPETSDRQQLPPGSADGADSVPAPRLVNPRRTTR